MRCHHYSGWIREASSDLQDSNIAYIIPRPGSDGLCMLGGTYFPHDYDCVSDDKQSQGILQRCFDLDPRLAGQGGTSWRDIKVVDRIAGLRPVRTGGHRVESESRIVSNRQVTAIHAYGFGALGCG